MNYYLQSAKHLFQLHLLRRRVLTARAPEMGLVFRVLSRDAMARRIYKRGMLDAELTRWLVGRVRLGEGDVVLDVGANVGWYSLCLARDAAAGARIYAFEPDEVNHALLTENVAANRAAPCVVPVRKAASDRPGTRTLYLYDPKNAGRHSLLPVNAAGRSEVEAVTLDAFLGAEGIDPRRVRFLKVDVEGHELQVLEGARSLLGCVPLLLLEYSPRLMRQAGLDPTRLLDLLSASGYAPHVVRDGGLVPVDVAGLRDWDGQADHLWTLR